MSLSWLNPPHRALVVGINDYDAPKTLINPLTGCVADAHAIYDLLTQTLAMSPTDICLLTTENAPDTVKPTRAAILNGLRHFLGGSPRGSEVLFYYSGHGSYTKLHEDIKFGDQRGETIVPADARVGGVLDILDRELRVIRGELAQKGIRLTLIADSCFSGDVMRGEPKRVGEAVPRMTGQPHAAPRTIETVLDNEITLSALQAIYNQQDDNTYTLISGCLSTQQSYEVPAGATRRGVMTTALMAGLQAAKGPVTYAELGQLIPAFLTPQQLARQLPNVSGDVERGIFGSIVPEREAPLFAITAVNPDSTIQLRSGLIAGLEDGSELQGFTDWGLSAPAGKWTITEVAAQTATAKCAEGATPMQPGQPLRLLTLSNRPTVWFDPSAKKVQAAWKDKLAGTPMLVETPKAGSAVYIVSLEQGDYVARRSNGVVHPTLRISAQNPRAPYDLARQLNRVACYFAFAVRTSQQEDRLDLPPLNQAGGIALRIEQLEWSGGGTPLMEGDAGELPARARLRLSVGNNSAESLWVAIYLLDEPALLAERLYPDNSDFLLQAAAARDVIWQNNDWSGGRLTLKLIVSTEEITAVAMPRFPCGKRETDRGLFLLNSLNEQRSRWTTYEVIFGR